MKISRWLIGLLAAFSVMFFACAEKEVERCMRWNESTQICEYTGVEAYRGKCPPSNCP